MMLRKHSALKSSVLSLKNFSKLLNVLTILSGARSPLQHDIKKNRFGVPVLKTCEKNLVLHVAVLDRTKTKCTKSLNPHAQVLSCLLNLSLLCILIAVI